MKNLGRLFSLVLAFVMVVTLAGTAMADDTAAASTPTGTITVSGAVKGAEYSIWRIFDLESYDAEAGTYAYKVNSAWKTFIDTKSAYVAVSDDGYVTWVKDADPVPFAKDALAYAKGNPGIAAVETKTAGDGVLSFTDLPLGYYLLDSTVGSLCALDTMNPNAELQEKNSAPSNVKQVKEDSTDTFSEMNDADIGQTVEFQSTITVGKGAQNYVFHDKMGTGLTFTAGSVKVKKGNDEVAEQGNYEVVTAGLTDGCTFEVQFTDAFVSDLKENDKIAVSYAAVVNHEAVVGSAIKNESKVSYGETGKTTMTPPSETKTYTWEVNIFKYAEKAEGETKTENPLAGAKFILYKREGTGENEIIKYAVVDSGKITGWVNTEASATKVESGADGKISIKGLDSDTYWLKETDAPAGYNKLKNDVEFKIDSDGKVKDSTNKELANQTVKIENKAGSILPSTGGIGTTVFYILGGGLLVGAAVMLAVKKRYTGRY